MNTRQSAKKHGSSHILDVFAVLDQVRTYVDVSTTVSVFERQQWVTVGSSAAWTTEDLERIRELLGREECRVNGGIGGINLHFYNRVEE